MVASSNNRYARRPFSVVADRMMKAADTTRETPTGTTLKIRDRPGRSSPTLAAERERSIVVAIPTEPTWRQPREVVRGRSARAVGVPVEWRAPSHQATARGRLSDSAG